MLMLNVDYYYIHLITTMNPLYSVPVLLKSSHPRIFEIYASKFVMRAFKRALKTYSEL